MGHIILFSEYDFKGDHKHVVGDQADLTASDDVGFNDRTKSFVILDGAWQLFRDADYATPYDGAFGPGAYIAGWLYGVDDNTLSSLQITSDTPTVKGGTIMGEVTAFVDAGFRGDHRHFFLSVEDFTDPAVNFNDVASSLVVEGYGAIRPNVTLFTDVYYGQLEGTVGTGAYSYLGDYGLPNDALSSIGITGHIPGSTVMNGDQAFGEVILFENIGFRGRHRHVYTAEPDLSVGSNPFAGITSSFFIRRGAWAFSTQPNYQALVPSWETSGYFEWPWSSANVKPPPFFTTGAYSWVEDYGIPNDTIASVHMPQPDLYLWDAVVTPPEDLVHQAFWLVVVTGPHSPGAIQVAASLLPGSPGGETAQYTDQGPVPPTTDHQFAVFQYPPSGPAEAYAYVLLPFAADLFPGSNAIWLYVNAVVQTMTDGEYGSSPESASATWGQPPPPPPQPQLTTVPDVLGKDLLTATNLISSAGLTWSEVVNPFLPPNALLTVVYQSPDPGRRVPDGTSVTIGLNSSTAPAQQAGYSQVLLYNENTDSTSYQVWMSSGGQAATDLGSIDSSYDPSTGLATQDDPFTVTLTDGAWCTVYVEPMGENPSDAGSAVYEQIFWGDENGPVYSAPPFT